MINPSAPTLEKERGENRESRGEKETTVRRLRRVRRASEDKGTRTGIQSEEPR